MKTGSLRQLAADAPVFGLWITLESPSITEIVVALGVDWVVPDAEHGYLDWASDHLTCVLVEKTFLRQLLYWPVVMSPALS